MIGDLDSPVCSRAGCRAAPTWRIDWRNPRIHAADRVKTWVACAEHRDYLREFLAARQFPVSVAPLAAESPAAR
ncbi:hypothetical protein [Microbacterium thalassium]|uniref:Acetone carboxylase n=1 Tax=Microbacterium thalassium TaxID=362649 RepID=A0A7X0FQD1_9MICO|nr:hypothetical protein [Microbacterium thalassium]MBB6391767.1 hypothetical protein [Microbacterium thalassium]GLK24369.1 hypothetical protein GCM10017607_16870 [Microbacterium thalassium]